ncbi:4-hydroxybenzoyl-CoA thioesterase family active site [hydrothermal vent metagenome]|uniref:4-hydroxybenzoyl-CoA thioesterase family active site n=1 Tax=hydrothermal vent metagenome TaxID=652676 RepID=A0A1W1C6H3_9ZZZZ
MQIRVYYEDTDIGGVVYYANYLKFCERARSELFFKREMMPYSESGHFFVKNLQAEYLASAKLGDLLDVQTKLLKISAASFVLHQEIVCGEQKLFEMDITLVYVDLKGRVKRLDKETRALIKELFA